MQQVLVNLLMNAMQSLDEPHACPRKVVTISTYRESNTRLGVGVTDTGRGFAEEVLGQAFTRNVTTKPKGMGMGLMICGSIIRAHGGEIRVFNHPTAGAHVQISLPTADQQARRA